MSDVLKQSATPLCRRLGLGLPAVLLLACLPATVLGQAAKIPPPEDVEIKHRSGVPLTPDKLIIKATFYPGLKKEKSIPIIMLHGFRGNRTEYADLAKFLQESHGHAVLVPDLRGHGDSTTFADGTMMPDIERLTPDDFEKMVADLEACKEYLRHKNNAGELNIDKLCIIAAESGAVVAMNWAVLNWREDVRPIATGRQGDFVKALVLLSPSYAVEKGRLNMAPALKTPDSRGAPAAGRFAISILYGSDKAPRSLVTEVKRLNSQLAPMHMGTDQTLYFDEVKTSLQGTKLLTAPGLPMKDVIAGFIKISVADKDIPWDKRLRPFEQP